MPGEKIGIQRVPLRFGAHAGPHSLARDYQAFRGERAKRLAQRRPRDLEPLQESAFVREERARRIYPGDDFAAEDRGERIVLVAHPRRPNLVGDELAPRNLVGDLAPRRRTRFGDGRLDQYFTPQKYLTRAFARKRSIS